MSIPREAEGNLLKWVLLGKKKAQRTMDAEWDDINEAVALVQQQSTSFEDIRKTMLDVKSFVESATKRQEDTNTKFLEMFSKINAKIEGQK